MSKNETKTKKNDIVETVDNTVEDMPFTEEAISEVETITGVVSACRLLNVRKNPKANGEVLCTIPVKAKVTINPSKSTAGWYKVTTEAGVDGFCMKQFITAKA